MSHTETRDVEIGDLYMAGLIASALSYLGILMLVTLSVAVVDDNFGAMLGVLFLGGMYSIIPALLIAMVLTAPLGCIIAKLLLRFSPPSLNLGAATGLLTAFASLAIMTVAFAEFRARPDAGTIVFVLGILAICTGAGAFAQRKVLPEASLKT
ncbi:MAG: hypothetical protein AAFR64_11150 [Pseudomonadota bacterium]